MTVATESPVCFYHRAASGEAYFAADKRRSCPIDNAAEVLDVLPPAARLRVIGVADNAEFMLTCRKQRPDVAIEVGGPGLCLYPGELRRPEIVIQRMRQALLSASLGGFHRWGFPDLAAYQLIHFLSCDKKFSARVRRAAAVHPAWYDLGFLPTLDKPS